MTPEAQRIAIAKLCPAVVEWHDDKPYWKGSYSGVGEGNEHFAEFNPIYDLNAMFEAEKALTEQEQASYALFLHGKSRRVRDDHLGRDFDVLHSSAEQCAEAFLRIKGKWVDSADSRGYDAGPIILDPMSTFTMEVTE